MTELTMLALGLYKEAGSKPVAEQEDWWSGLSKKEKKRRKKRGQISKPKDFKPSKPKKAKKPKGAPDSETDNSGSSPTPRSDRGSSSSSSPAPSSTQHQTPPPTPSASPLTSMGAGLAGSAVGALAGSAAGLPLAGPALVGGAAGSALPSAVQKIREMGAKVSPTTSSTDSTPAAPAAPQPTAVSKALDTVKGKAIETMMTPSNLRKAIGTVGGGVAGMAAGTMFGLPGMAYGAYRGARAGHEALRPPELHEQIAEGIKTITPQLSNLGDEYLKFVAKSHAAGGTKPFGM